MNKRSAVKPGQWIVLPGAGGGLGHFAVQYAKAMGMRVITINDGSEKEALCKKLGADHFIDFTTEEDIAARVRAIMTLGAHGVVVTASLKCGYEAAPSFLRFGGTIVAVGLLKEDFLVGASPFQLVFRRLNIVGSVTGTLKDVDQALEVDARDLVKPIIVKGSMIRISMNLLRRCWRGRYRDRRSLIFGLR